MSRQTNIRNPFQEQATISRVSLIGEFWHFLKASKKWWMLPIFLTLLLFGALVFLGNTAVAPFIYTLF